MITLPRRWNTLPGPSHYMEQIVAALREGLSVWAYFPFPPHYVSTRLRKRLLGDGWERVSDRFFDADEAPREDPIYWCEIENDSFDIQAKFKELVVGMRSQEKYPRICLLTRSNDHQGIKALRKVDGVRVIAWPDFVTIADSRVLVERFGRKKGWSIGYSEVMSFVVSQITKSNITQADVYASMPLGEILSDMSVGKDDIWNGQVQVLYPRINSFRLKMIRKYSSVLKVPYEVELGNSKSRVITEIENLEISHIWWQIRDGSAVDYPDRIDLKYAVDVRNELAHFRVLDLDRFKSDSCFRVLGFKIPHDRNDRA